MLLGGFVTRWSPASSVTLRLPFRKAFAAAAPSRRFLSSCRFRTSSPSSTLGNLRLGLTRRAVGGGGKRRTLTTTGAVTTNNVVKVDRPVAYWLLGCGGMVAGMVLIGGITRLTRSGLSMTSWKPLGSLPPTSHSEWEEEFERYKTFPEWQQRRGMTLDEFKFIFAWEWAHRNLGRTLGLAFGLPLLYFGARGRIPKHLYPRLGALFGLGATQALIGWWMVRSGLSEARRGDKHEIRVSPYRLTVHLSLAFTTFGMLLWTGLDILSPREAAQRLRQSVESRYGAGAAEILKKAATMRSLGVAATALVATTVVSGAFVAGNDAGRAYNTWPMMDGQWIPDEVLEFELKPAWRNFFENTATVQFDHRALAYTTFGTVVALYAAARRGAGGAAAFAALPRQTRLATHAVMGTAVAQVGLGISTLLTYVPVPLAAAHQSGAVTLFAISLWLLHTLRFARIGTAAAGSGAAVGGCIKAAAK